MKKMKIAMLFSGGVDSSVAMKLLQEEGHDVTAHYLKIWLEDEMAFMGDCPWEEDMAYVRQTCDQLGIPLKVVNMQQEYFDTVVEYTINELKAGRTPSPDIMCNQNIKFGLFFKKMEAGYDKVASGHYAQIQEVQGKYLLKEAPDTIKDQTYFLTYLSQEQLSKIIFPIGKYSKEEVRLLAEKYQLPAKSRKDSQGICFLGKIKYNEFIDYYLGEVKGEIIEIETDKVLGQHKGYWYHTIGQRQGLGLGDGPWYVVKKDLEKNIVYVSKQKKSDEVLRDELIATNINWIPEQPSETSLKVKLRHGPRKYNCTIEYIDQSTARVKLDVQDQGLAAGQFAIFYCEDYCLGGGMINLISKEK
jgi:tRNA (5-methylaminomethyl-2-thiouridylate)-methyltransferase